jgi:DNA-binding MarR family transcriptional regulator
VEEPSDGREDGSGAGDASLIYVVGRVNQGIRREMGAVLRQWDLSVQDYTALSVLRSRPGLSNAQLARRTLVSPQSMLEILARLEDRDLLVREVDPAHRRVLRAQLTSAGQALLDAADPCVQQIQDRVFAGVTPAQRRSMMAALGTAMRHLSGRP